MTTQANRGRFFEEYLQHLHTRYREQGRARIDFIPTPTRAHNGRDGVTWKPVHKGIVDFVGVLSGGRFVAFDAKSTHDVHGWSVKVSRRSPANDAAHQWEYLADVHALGGLAFYLIYAETLDRVFVARMPFPVEERQRFTDMIEVIKDENGWWDWLRALEEAGILRPCLPIVPSVPPCGQSTAPANRPNMV
jgi:penicillin-binding protein-related factor A (putative recombinase)